MSDEEALDMVWPGWANPIAPSFVSGVQRSPREAINEMEREARQERGGGGWTVRWETFRRLTSDARTGRGRMVYALRLLLRADGHYVNCPAPDDATHARTPRSESVQHCERIRRALREAL